MRNLYVALLLAGFLFAMGCSGGEAIPVVSGETKAANEPQSHYMWGIWQFSADPQKGALDVVQLRGGNFHLNALPFLEPPALVNLTLESLEFNGNIIEADIGLKHPFLGLNEFTGFDVCGVLITSGSVTGFADNKLRMAGDGDTRLLNPDGYTRWWNPSEFPVGNTMFNYKDGLLGTPDSVANFNATLNGYKYFCDDLSDPNEPISHVNLPGRGKFGAGQKNIRHYSIELGNAGLVFNYAVDASWEFPQGSPPWVVPDDFGPGANKAEPWRVDVTETQNTLWNDGSSNGGGLRLSVDVFDWQDPSMNILRVESPGNFVMVEQDTPSGGGSGYSTYDVEILNATPGQGSIDLLLSVASDEPDFEGFIDGTNTTAYFTHTAQVSSQPPANNLKNIPLRDGVMPFDITIDPVDGRVLIIYDDGEIWQYKPANDYQTPDPNNKYYDADWEVLKPDHPTAADNVTAAYLDIADNRYTILSINWYCNDWQDRSWYDVIDNNGQYVNRLTPVGIFFGVSYINNDCMAYGTGSGDPNYMNRLATVWGHALPWYSFNNWSLPGDNYSTSPYDYWYLGSSSGCQYGKNQVFGPYVKGAEVDADDLHAWYLERDDCYCARFLDVTYDNAFCGTGAPTDSDNGFNSPKDLTRNADDILIALDTLSDGTSRLKAFDPADSTDSVPAESLGGLDLDGIIIGPALRIDCGDYIHPSWGNILMVLHGDETDGYYMSVFLPDELPW